MQLQGAFQWVFNVGNWLYKFLFLHLLWIMFTLLGLGVFGIFPATFALFSVTQKIINEDTDTPIFRNFVNAYKRDFVSANLVGLLMVVIGVFFYVDFVVSKQFLQNFFIHFILMLMILLYTFTLLFLFPVFVRYELKTFYYLKQSFLIAIAQPLESIAMIFCLFCIYFLFSVIPLTLIFAGSSLFAFPISWLALQAFKKVEEKNQLSN